MIGKHSRRVKGVFFGVSLFLAACGDSGGPNTPDPQGIWRVTAIGGANLPAPSDNAGGTVTGGILRLVSGTSWWETCVDRGSGEASHFIEAGYSELDDTRVLLVYHGTGLGPPDPDTLTVDGDQATLAYRESALTPPAEHWTLARIGGADVSPSETPNACP